MNNNIFTRISIAMLLFSSFSFAQFGNVDITFDDRLLRDGDRQQLAPLQDEIKRFFQNTEWDEEYGDLEIPLHIQIIFDGTSTKGSEMVYLAQALFSNGIDQRYFDKSFNFRQSETGSLYYDAVIFDPLASFLAYYANLIIAGEVDTYEPKGGNRFYEIARSIALRGTQSDYQRGWSERLRIENLLSSNHGFRKVRLAVYLGLEHFEYGEFDDAIKQFNVMIEGLDEVHLQSPREHYTMLFINGHADKLAKVLGFLKQAEILQSLIELDPDNREIYEEEFTYKSK